MGDLRTEKTMESLKTAFLQLLEKYRFEAITVKKLCECANIRRATFYSHFADKYEFLAYFIQKMREELLVTASARSPHPAEEENGYYDVLFHELILFFEAHPKLVQNVNNSQILATMMDIFAEEVQRSVYEYLVEKSEGDDHRLLEMKSHFYAGGVLQLIRLWMENPENYNISEVNWLAFLE